MNFRGIAMIKLYNIPIVLTGTMLFLNIVGLIHLQTFIIILGGILLNIVIAYLETIKNRGKIK
jgi:hypothetical protein